ncbi:L-arabinolactonase [compost metagenome]
MKARLVIDTQSTLGEGPIWSPIAQKLYWVDIDRCLLHWYDPAIQLHQSIVFDQKISTVVPGTDGALILAMKDGVYSYDTANSKLQLIVSNPENSTTGNRFNDGKCDPSGRLWLGTMGNQHSAALYRIDADYNIQTMVSNISTSNGIVWSLDQKSMYYIDSDTYKVIAYDFDNQTGQISNPQEVITIPTNMGMPDGSTLDSEGMIWIALWGGYAVTRWNPENGKLLATVAVPSKNVTACAFGGKNLDLLYITTAQTSDTDLSRYPNSGGLFVVKPGTRGIEANFFQNKR